MQSKGVSVLSTAFVLIVPAMLHAQVTSSSAPVPSRFIVGADGILSQPKGEFAGNVGHGFGFNLDGLYKLDYKGYLSIRADFGGLEYGRERNDASFFGITGRVTLDLETTNSIGWGSIGPQIMIPDGPFRPYANAAIALTDFTTSSSLTDAFGNELASTQNASDVSHAWVFGSGVQIPFGTTGSLNLGARYYYGGRATYLTRGDITDNPDGSVTLHPRNSKTDMVLWQLGFSLAIPQGNGH